MKLLTIPDLADRWRCHPKTARAIVLRPEFPRPIMPTGSVRLRLWAEGEIERWESKDGRRAA